MLRKLWKILWIGTLSSIAFIVIVAVLVSIFVPEEELEKASASTKTAAPPEPPPEEQVTELPPPLIEYKTVDWTRTPEEQGLKVGDWIVARGHPGGFSGALRVKKGENYDLLDIDIASGQYFLRSLPNATFQAFELSYFADAGDVSIMATKSPLPPTIKTGGVIATGIPNHAQHPVITQLNLLTLHELAGVTEIIVSGQISRVSSPYEFEGYPRQSIRVDDIGCTLKLTATPEDLARAMEQAKANAAAVKQKFEQLQSQFSAWDGTHKNTTIFVKERLHNPKSFEHVKTTFITNEEKGFRIINMTYRGTNVYNAIVTNTIRVKVDLDGNVIGVITNK